MSDSQWLFVVLSLVYLSDCLAWADLYSVSFTTWLGGRWRIRRPGAVLGNERGGLLFNPPLPPLGLAVVARPWPVSLSPAGVYAYVAQAAGMDRRPPQQPHYFDYSAVRTVEAVAKHVRFDGARLLGMDREAQAVYVAGLIRELLPASAGRREAIIDAALAHAFDGQAIRARLDECRRVSAPLVWRCNFLFAGIFAAGPLMVWAYGWERTWLGLLLGLTTLLVLTAWEFCGAHRALYPDERGARGLQTAVMLLNPLAAIRARDALARDLLVAHHPLAVARELCPSSVFLEFARGTYLDAVTPLAPECPSPHDQPHEVLRWFSAKLRAAMEVTIRQADIDPASLLAPDPPDDPTCLTYCPRCLTQFQREAGDCSTCGGLPLRPLVRAQGSSPLS